MRKLIIIFCIILSSCGSTKQCKATSSSINENQEVEQRVMGGLLFGLVTYIFFSVLKK
jgi:hypothetical protein